MQGKPCNPIFTLALSALILKQHITMADIIGTGLVLLGVGLYTYLDQRATRQSSSSG